MLVEIKISTYTVEQLVEHLNDLISEIEDQTGRIGTDAPEYFTMSDLKEKQWGVSDIYGSHEVKIIPNEYEK